VISLIWNAWSNDHRSYYKSRSDWMWIAMWWNPWEIALTLVAQPREGLNVINPFIYPCHSTPFGVGVALLYLSHGFRPCPQVSPVVIYIEARWACSIFPYSSGYDPILFSVATGVTLFLLSFWRFLLVSTDSFFRFEGFYKCRQVPFTDLKVSTGVAGFLFSFWTFLQV
jgi:hypothetical protein